MSTAVLYRYSPTATTRILESQIQPQSDAQCFLRRLPKEIRQLIYEALAHSTKIDLELYLKCNNDRSPPGAWTWNKVIKSIHPVFLLCKQTLQEARPIFLREATYRCCIYGLYGLVRDRMYRSKSPHYALENVKHLEISRPWFVIGMRGKPIDAPRSDIVRDLRMVAPRLQLKSLSITDHHALSWYLHRGWPGLQDRERRCRIAMAKLIQTALGYADELAIAIRPVKELAIRPPTHGQDWTSSVCYVRIRGGDKRVWVRGESDELVKEVKEDLKTLPEVEMKEWTYDLIVV